MWSNWCLHATKDGASLFCARIQCIVIYRTSAFAHTLALITLLEAYIIKSLATVDVTQALTVAALT